MLEFFREAPYGAIILVVVGTVGYFAMAPIEARNGARLKQLEKRGDAQTPDDAEARRQVFYVKFIAMGMIVAGCVWWILS